VGELPVVRASVAGATMEGPSRKGSYKLLFRRGSWREVTLQGDRQGRAPVAAAEGRARGWRWRQTGWDWLSRL